MSININKKIIKNRICIASRKTGPSSSGPVHYNTGPAEIIQKYGTGPIMDLKVSKKPKNAYKKPSRVVLIDHKDTFQTFKCCHR